MDNNTPLVSIILPTYNGSQYLSRSIESCLQQTYKNVELVIVDDHSTDNTPLIIKSFMDNRINYVRNETNQRLPKSLNIGFSKARGEFLTWTSDDNFYTPNAIENMMYLLLEEKRDFVYSAYFSLKNNEVENAKIVRFPTGASLRHVNYVRACFLYSRKVKETIGDYNPETELSEDYDYWIRVSKKFQLSYLPKPLYFYRYHDNALFSKRYWEQGVVKCLVRVRHEICSIEEAIKDLIELYARKKSRRIIRPFVFYSGLIFKTSFLKDHLLNLQNGSLSFPDCKQAIIQRIF